MVGGAPPDGEPSGLGRGRVLAKALRLEAAEEGGPARRSGLEVRGTVTGWRRDLGCPEG